MRHLFLQKLQKTIGAHPAIQAFELGNGNRGFAPTVPPRTTPHMPFEPDSQMFVPDSFVQIYVLPGRHKPSIPLVELANRYELCEDMAQMLMGQVSLQQFSLGITETLALDHCLKGLCDMPEVLSTQEAQWVVSRLAELLCWPLPHFENGSAAQNQG
jgi:hypothetical protein